MCISSMKFSRYKNEDHAFSQHPENGGSNRNSTTGRSALYAVIKHALESSGKRLDTAEGYLAKGDRLNAFPILVSLEAEYLMFSSKIPLIRSEEEKADLSKEIGIQR